MSQTLGSKADGSLAEGSGGDSRKGKCGLLTMKVIRDWKDKALEDVEKTFHIQFEGFTLSKGLILKAQFEVYNPLSCAIPKWKSIRYSVKIADCYNLEIPGSGREIANGKVPSKWLRAKEKTTVEMTINASLKHVGDKLQEIILQTIIDGLLKVELEITFRYPIIGKHTIHPKFPIDVSVSDALGKHLSPNLYKVLQVVLRTVEGNTKNIPDALLEILEALTRYYDDKKKALDHVADDFMKNNLEQITVTVQLLEKCLIPSLNKVLRVVLDTIEGNKKNIPDALLEILEALTQYYDDKKKALDHVADDFMKDNLKRISVTVKAIEKFLNSGEYLGDLKDMFKKNVNKLVEAVKKI
ncbi:uncharacterized protein LOC131334627 [Rhododendron vialii]|uniref:uncharacterized protein LOC131334627 n=1 Tax=Rhododendron vialii TaxID=182163 RepID=UPI00265D73D7|nr:uncharacterized protein LOC131334627 [Rhododendron vialii]